jgi:ribose 1,5-bisphosphate isomerase
MNAKVEEISKNIKDIHIQGATNVALATLDGIRISAKKYKKESIPLFIKHVISIGKKLSEARENEPLARNAVKYIRYMIKKSEISSFSDAKKTVLEACDKYREMISEAKRKMIEVGIKVLEKESVVLTHCHSSSATSILINAYKERKRSKKKFQVFSTETRPLYQGRKTVKELLAAKVPVTQIVDSAAASFIIEDQYEKIGAAIVGCDELLKDGSFINKVGTYQVALAATVDKDEFFVATTLLKFDPTRSTKDTKIEQRDEEEVWEDAPKGLRIINPAFDQVRAEFVTAYITEAGLLTNKEIVLAAKKEYPWMWN